MKKEGCSEGQGSWIHSVLREHDVSLTRVPGAGVESTDLPHRGGIQGLGSHKASRSWVP